MYKTLIDMIGNFYDETNWGKAGSTPNHPNGANLLALGGHVKSVAKPGSKASIGTSWNNRIICWADEN